MFDITVYIFLFLIGAALGSFANVVIYRLPEGLSVVTPRSRCPKCLKNIQWYYNIPIFGWFVLKGKCHFCKAPISWRYPLVELVMAILFVITFYFHGFSWLTLEYLIFIFGLVTVTFIDFDHMILPDVFTLSGIVIGLAGALINPERQFLDSFLGFFFGGGILWSLAYFYTLIRKEEGMGGGDIKLLGWIGAILGWKAIPFVIISSSLIGSIVGIVVMIKQRQGLKTVIPFGPYLALGSLLFMYGGEAIAIWYLNLLMPWLN